MLLQKEIFFRTGNLDYSRFYSFFISFNGLVFLRPSSGCSAESVDVHGVLLLSLLHRGQSLHWTAQVNSDSHDNETQWDKRDT